MLLLLFAAAAAAGWLLLLLLLLQADIYSYGIVLWELCALQKPFAGMSSHEHARKVNNRASWSCFNSPLRVTLRVFSRVATPTSQFSSSHEYHGTRIWNLFACANVKRIVLAVPALLCPSGLV